MHILFTSITLLSFLFGPNLSAVKNEGKKLSAEQVRKESTKVDISKIEPRLSAECEPLTTIGSCVNVISGCFFQVEKDLSSHSIEPLSLIRCYDSACRSVGTAGLGFGLSYPLWISEIQEGSRHAYALISERESALIPYQRNLRTPKQKGKAVFRVDSRLKEKRMTNVCQSGISGSTNLMNWKALHQGFWNVYTGNGTKRLYAKEYHLSTEQRLQLNLPSTWALALTLETLPNGNQLRFKYDEIHNKVRLTQITAYNRTGTGILDQLNFEYKKGQCEVTNSAGLHVLYEQKDAQLSGNAVKILTKVNSSQKGTYYYQSNENEKSLRIEKIEKPKGQFIAIQYEPTHSYVDAKVLKIFEPRGTQNETIETYRFRYDKNCTHVWDALHNKTSYHFNHKERITSIDYLYHKQLIKQDTFHWSILDGQEGWLRAKAVQIGDQLSYLKTFRYDSRGNIIRETTYGNITGQKPATFAITQKLSMDSTFTEYRYSDDGFNLLLEKKTPEGVTIKYSYLPGTNLLTQELHLYDGQIQERIFRDYDDNGQVSRYIEDDGNGLHLEDLTNVTFRKMTLTFSNTTPGAAFGKPQSCHYYMLDPQQNMTALYHIEFSYDGAGNAVQQRTFNANNELCSETKKEYNDKQQVILKQNALGHQKRYFYDRRGRKKKKRYIHAKKTVYYTYDQADRLISITRAYDGEERFTTAYTYNGLDQLVSEIDPYGQETHYQYDRLGRQISISQPSIQVSGQEVHPTSTKSYNILSQVIAHTNENGFTTSYTYNIFGSPLTIEFPDGTRESYLYDTNGKLIQQWLADGTSMQFTYNPKGDLLQQSYLDITGNVIKQEGYVYKASRLLSTIDGAGCLTFYAYDGAGRKILENVHNIRITHYVYDDFGKIIEEIRQVTPEIIQKEIYQYDALDRLVSKEKIDSKGILYAKETYTYDANNQQNQHCIYHSSEQQAIYQTYYNKDNTLQFTQDPLGERKSYTYNHHYINPLQQQVLCRGIFDALHRYSEDIYDAHHRLIRQDIYEENMLVSRTHFNYDAIGSLLQTVVEVKDQSTDISTYTVQNLYNTRGWKIYEIENHISPTHFIYDQRGRIIQETPPNGISLNYVYDGLGRVITKQSSDGTIFYTYHYENHDKPVLIIDHVQNTYQKRKYDILRRLLEEEIVPGIIITYGYDSLDRLTHLGLPDGSHLKYVYNAFHLIQMERYDEKEQKLYSCFCPRYNLAGYPLQIDSPATVVEFAYDLLNRKTAIQTPFWQANNHAFDPCGNLLSFQQKDPSGTYQLSFTYDRFNHLTSEKGILENQFTYDNLGNCLTHQARPQTNNTLNQLQHDGKSSYHYDQNGNLIQQGDPLISYQYDALNRLVQIKTPEKQTQLIYDSFGRLLKILQDDKTQYLIYQEMREIGSWQNNCMQELRCLHPIPQNEQTFAIELHGTPYFPIQDFRNTICALQTTDGALAEYQHHTAFESLGSSILGNPWRFANQRQIEALTLFTHRFYHPQMRRWLTKDPLGFQDGLHLYAYVHNNPLRYHDPDGRFAFAIPIFQFTFSAAMTLSSPIWLPAFGVTVGSALIGYGCYKLCTHLANQCDESIATGIEPKEETKEEKFKKRGKPAFCGEKLGNDATKCPGKGFEWRGNGDPRSGFGSWVRGSKAEGALETLHPDFNHAPPKGPHWDYVGPNGEADLYLDGTWGWKN